jgi:predicted patatin/cPLA2 family phospholipase
MQKTAIILSGGGMRCAYSAGAMYALATELNFKSPDILIVGSGSAGTGSFYTSKQYESIKSIWTERLSTRKFINFFRFWKIIDIDYLIDVVFKKLEPLDTKAERESEIQYLISTTNTETGEVEYFSNKDNVDVFELMRASKSIPVFFNKKVKINGKLHNDSPFSSSAYIKIEKAKELGANKIIVINNIYNNGFFKLLEKFYLFFKNKYFNNYKKINFTNYRSDKNIIIIEPKSKLKIGTLSNKKTCLLQTFNQGFKDIITNEKLKNFLTER